MAERITKGGLNMQVSLCDCCGKVIKDKTKEYNLQMFPTYTVRDRRGNQRLDDVDYSLKYPNLCMDCANTIYHYVQALSKED